MGMDGSENNDDDDDDDDDDRSGCLRMLDPSIVILSSDRF